MPDKRGDIDDTPAPTPHQGKREERGREGGRAGRRERKNVPPEQCLDFITVFLQPLFHHLRGGFSLDFWHPQRRAHHHRYLRLLERHERSPSKEGKGGREGGRERVGEKWGKIEDKD